jgi:hypothetical protein
MTSLLWCFPDIPFNARVVTPSASTDPDLNEYNLFSGQRSRYGQFLSTATTRNIVFDMGSDYASRQSAVNYLSLARADKLQAAGVTQVQLESSPDNSIWTSRINVTSFGSQTLFGPRLADFITTISATANIRYWKLTYTAGSAINFLHSKSYFGSYFDFGIEPNDFEPYVDIADSDPFITDSGARIEGRIEDQKYRYVFYYSGISDALVKQFENYLMSTNYREGGVMLYTASIHQILDNMRMLHGEIIDFESKKSAVRDDWNDLRIEVREMLG